MIENMVTITEDYVSFEIAKLLKEKGFDCSCEHQYINCSSGHPFLTDIRDDAGCYYKNSEIGQDEYSAPTLQMAMKWLREMYQIDIQVFRHIRGKRITFYARIEQNTHLEHQDHCNLYQFHEHACEKAIKYCLENLI